MPHNLNARLRGSFNRALLNPLFTRLYDRIWPVNSLGARGERQAERFLLKQGLIIVDRGYTDMPGEIDLIAVDGETIVFVEVKTRITASAGSPEEAVDQIKQEKIIKTALSYLKRHDLLEFRCRFDVISILWSEDRRDPQLAHFESAFEAGEGCW